MPQWLAQADPAGGGRGELLAHADHSGVETKRRLMPHLLAQADQRGGGRRELMPQWLARAAHGSGEAVRCWRRPTSLSGGET